MDTSATLLARVALRCSTCSSRSPRRPATLALPPRSLALLRSSRPVLPMPALPPHHCRIPRAPVSPVLSPAQPPALCSRHHASVLPTPPRTVPAHAPAAPSNRLSALRCRKSIRPSHSRHIAAAAPATAPATPPRHTPPASAPSSPSGTHVTSPAADARYLLLSVPL